MGLWAWITWQPRCPKCNVLSKDVDKVSCGACRAKLEATLSKVTPELARYIVDKHVVEFLYHNWTEKHANAMLSGSAMSGKSTLINFLVSVIAGLRMTPVGEGGMRSSVGASEAERTVGHNTIRMRRVAMVRTACLTSRQQLCGSELTIVDSVGIFEDDREHRCAALGQLADAELWPSQEAEMRAIEARPATLDGAAHVMALVISANTLLNIGSSRAMLERVLRFAKEYPLSVGGKSQELHVVLVVTQVDLWAKSNGCSDPRCLLGGRGGFLKPLFEASEKLGMSAHHVTPIGWLTDDDINYSNHKDPRVVVGKYLVHQLWSKGTMFRSTFGGGTASAPPLSPTVAR